jgi:hypothetical protein
VRGQQTTGADHPLSPYRATTRRELEPFPPQDFPPFGFECVLIGSGAGLGGLLVVSASFLVLELW